MTSSPGKKRMKPKKLPPKCVKRLPPHLRAVSDPYLKVTLCPIFNFKRNMLAEISPFSMKIAVADAKRLRKLIEEQGYGEAKTAEFCTMSKTQNVPEAEKVLHQDIQDFHMPSLNSEDVEHHTRYTRPKKTTEPMKSSESPTTKKRKTSSKRLERREITTEGKALASWQKGALMWTDAMNVKNTSIRTRNRTIVDYMGIWSWNLNSVGGQSEDDWMRDDDGDYAQQRAKARTQLRMEFMKKMEIEKNAKN